MVKEKNKKVINNDTTADFLREKFLEFFKSKKHKIVPSDSLIPCDDPTVLFTSAGMNQFKKQFLGMFTDFRRAATAQRCLRTDDLDKVGKTNYHHTFFEMLGNFSFGDYFKKEAIAFAWEFLTKELKISEDKLWVSVYKEDTEAYNIWRDNIGLPPEKIIKLGDKQNFWPAEAKTKGPNGPCGPCSEIFFDEGSDVGCKRPECSPACDCGRFVEVWNLVFTQFNRKSYGTLEALPSKNIDTGMGLERLAAVMQGVHSNFETDLFTPIINEIETFAKIKTKELIWAIADHSRAITFAIYDGVMPSNEQRGYVVKKLIRKTTFAAHNLGINKPFIYKLVPIVAKIMHRPYPDLEKRRENIAQIILAEEKNFSSILSNADKLFKNKFKEYISGKVKGSSGTGLIAFELYDTYGIPFEVTRDWLIRHNLKVSLEEFNQRLTQQKELSKATSKMGSEVFKVSVPRFRFKATRFLGYEKLECLAKILGIVKDEKLISKCKMNDEVKLILDKTVFYAQAGGQVGDQGWIKKKNAEFEVYDTQMIDGVVLHLGKVIKGRFKKNDAVSAEIQEERRLSIARNHTATHLLQAVLRKVLGEHVKQQGSLVAEDRLRFDFTHFKDISKEELNRIESMVNQLILQNEKVFAKEMTLAEAKKIGALAFFGEKYQERVRVVSIGTYSRELCAGTHLKLTGSIGLFRIISESAIASGVRRIEAITGGFAYKGIKKEEEVLDGLRSRLNIPLENINEAVEKLNSQVKELEKRINSLQFNRFCEELNKIIQNAGLIKDIRVITYRIDEVGMDLLRRMSDTLKEKLSNTIYALGSVYNRKAFLVLGLTQDLVKKGLDARKFIKEIAAIIDGSGGGRADFTQAGGNNPQRLDGALERLKEII